MIPGHVFVLVGPSGGGKTTLIHRLTAADAGFEFVPSTTSRPPRPGEQDGIDYHFVAGPAFDQLLAGGEFLEHQHVHGFRYGSSRTRLLATVAQGEHGITSADILGAFKIKAALPANVTTVFVTPSHPDILRQRILARGPMDRAELDRRLSRVAMEMRLAPACDHLVLNDDVEAAVACLEGIAASQRAARVRLAHFEMRPVVPVVEVADPPEAACGTRFVVADCETPEAAVLRVLHQWWWERHPEAVRFALPEVRVRPTASRTYVPTASALLDVSAWSATCPDGRSFGAAIA